MSSPVRSYPKFILLVLSFVMRLVAFVQLWLIWFQKSRTDAQLQDANALDDKQKKAMASLQFMQSVYPILMSASLSIHILLELFGNTCSGTLLVADTLNIALIGLKVYPLVTFFLLRDTNLKAILCAWGYGLFIMLVCAIKFQSSDQLGEVVAFSFASTLVFYDSYRQQKAMMQIVEKLQQALELNDQLAVEAQALELRAMIGNVAHDLKTVRSYCLSPPFSSRLCTYCHYLM